MKSNHTPARSAATVLADSAFWHSEYEGLLARNSDSKTMMATEAWVVDALLASTLVIGPERKRLSSGELKRRASPS